MVYHRRSNRIGNQIENLNGSPSSKVINSTIDYEECDLDDNLFEDSFSSYASVNSGDSKISYFPNFSIFIEKKNKKKERKD